MTATRTLGTLAFLASGSRAGAPGPPPTSEHPGCRHLGPFTRPNRRYSGCWATQRAAFWGRFLDIMASARSNGVQRGEREGCAALGMERLHRCDTDRVLRLQSTVGVPVSALLRRSRSALEFSGSVSLSSPAERLPSNRLVPFLGELLRRLLAWRRPVPVPVPVRNARRGLTLVEMLVTMAITLVMMGAVVNVFARIGQSVNESQSTIEMAGMLRSARQMLQQDLAGATCPTIPWTKLDDAVGYFEIVEGPATDSDADF